MTNQTHPKFTLKLTYAEWTILLVNVYFNLENTNSNL